MSNNNFSPAWGSTTNVTNATSATSAVVLPKGCNAVMLTNASTSRVHVMLTGYENESSPPAGTAPTTSTGVPILANQQIIIRVGPGLAVLRTIASAVNGNTFITPGNLS